MLQLVALVAVLALGFWSVWKLWSQEGYYVPLPMGTVRAMLELADVGEGDVVYDLGCGDGRVVVEAARRGEGVEAVGVENIWFFYQWSRLWVRIAGVAGRTRIIFDDLFDVPLGNASVVVFYLTPKLAARLRGKLKKELRKGTRVVSAAHAIPGWKPARKIRTGHFWTYLYRM